MSATPGAEPREGWSLDRELVIGGLAVSLVYAMLVLVSPHWPYLLPGMIALAVLPFAPAPLRRPWGTIAFLVLALPFAFAHQSMGDQKLKTISAATFHGTFFAACYCNAAAVLALYTPPGTRQRLVRCLLFVSTALTFTGVGYPGWLYRLQVWSDATGLGDLAPHPHVVILVAAAVVSLGLVLGLRGDLRQVPASSAASGGRSEGGALARVLVGLLFVLALGVGVSITLSVRTNYERISQLFFELTRNIPLRATGGFSDQAAIGDVMANKSWQGGRTIALRAFGEGRPGYLRGKVFAVYVPHSGWSVSPPAPKESASGGQPKPRQGDAGRLTIESSEGRVAFPGRPAVPAEAQPDHRIVTSERYNAIYFTPLRALAVDSSAERLALYRGNILRSLDAPTVRGYQVYRAERVPLRREAEDPLYRQLPEDPELLAELDRHIAQAKLARGPHLRRTLMQLAEHFEANYEYQFGIDFREGPDPLVQFLSEKSHGHCELFASSGALLLRRLGYAARYVTGFVCEEKNAFDDQLWIARNGAAHAWVEVYDEREGWVTAEFTPSAGLPQPSSPSSFESLLDYLRGQWQRLKSVEWRQLPLEAALALRAAIDWILASWWRIAVALGLALAWLARWWRRRRPPAEGGPAVRALNPALSALRERFLAIEAELGAAGLGRAPAETLLEYAERLRAAERPEGLERDLGQVAALSEELALARYGRDAGASGAAEG